jgi:integrase
LRGLKPNICRAAAVPSTQRDYLLVLGKWIEPHFKNRKVQDIVFADCQALHNRIVDAGRGPRANTALAVLSKMFSLAIRWGMRGDNPAKGVERAPETKRKRYLSGDELARLTAALAKHKDKRAADVVRVLLLTGARRGETLAMRWGDLDLTAGLWTKPGATTKQKSDHTVPLAAPLRLLLKEIQDQQKAKHKQLGEYVFGNGGSGRDIVDLQRTWRQLCKAAKIDGLRVHDLRHSFASQLASGGASLPLIGALLGHSQPRTTARYAHLFQDPQRAAVERVAAIISAANGDESNAPVTPLPKRGRRGR